MKGRTITSSLKKDPKTGEWDIVCKHREIETDNPYSPWKDKGAWDMAIKAGWPTETDWWPRLKKMYKEKEQQEKKH